MSNSRQAVIFCWRIHIGDARMINDYALAVVIDNTVFRVPVNVDNATAVRQYGSFRVFEVAGVGIAYRLGAQVPAVLTVALVVVHVVNVATALQRQA